MRTDSRGFPSSMNVHIVGDFAAGFFRLRAGGSIVASRGCGVGGSLIEDFMVD